MGKGFLAGAATLVAAPTLGALQEGALGFGKGLAAGARSPHPRPPSVVLPFPSPLSPSRPTSATRSRLAQRLHGMEQLRCGARQASFAALLGRFVS